jgi:hydroxypyruvate isomerase
VNRRELLQGIPASLAVMSVGSAFAQEKTSTPSAGRRFKQGICKQVFGPTASVEDCCREAAKIGYVGFDLADDPSDWPILKRYGLVQSMFRVEPPRPAAPVAGAPRGGPPGWNAIGLKEAQGDFLASYQKSIDIAAENGFKNMLLQAGGRSATVSLEEGTENTVAFINLVKSHAEDKGITLCLEYLNSKGFAAPRGSFFDKMSWGVDVMKQVNSPHVKILYDIYHAQLMEGDIAQTIKDNIQYIAHIHTGGVPGRHEIDDTQEVNYRFLAKVIADTGFTGFFTQEWAHAMGSEPVSTAKRVFDIMNI